MHWLSKKTMHGFAGRPMTAFGPQPSGREPELIDRHQPPNRPELAFKAAILAASPTAYLSVAGDGPYPAPGGSGYPSRTGGLVQFPDGSRDGTLPPGSIRALVKSRPNPELRGETDRRTMIGNGLDERHPVPDGTDTNVYKTHHRSR